MLVVFGILALIVAGVLWNSTGGYAGPALFAVIGVVLILFGLQDD
jgi:hypothetical protein